MDIINQNLDQNDGDWGLALETHKGMHAVMAPGANLDRMVRNMLGLFTTFLDELVKDGKGGKEVDLYGWIRPHFTIASTEAVYGPSNPFKKHPDLGQAFWDFDHDFTMMLLGVAPRLLARKGYNGRKRIARALTEYFNSEGLKGATGVVQVRHDVGKKYGASTEEVSLFEMGDVLGVLVNATPTLFWCIVHFYSDPKLLADIRAEILASGCLKTEQGEDGKKKYTLDITTLQDSCPLLVSAYREILRHRTASSTSRWVTEDTLLNSQSGQYLVKKDSVLLIPGALIHIDPIWGPDAKQYQPRRFLEKNVGAKAGAYRAWGGGQTLCPGRFFATTEILGSVAMVVMRFEVRPVGGKGVEGVWSMPRVDGASGTYFSEPLIPFVSPPLSRKTCLGSLCSKTTPITCLTARTQAVKSNADSEICAVAASIQPPKEDIRVRVTEREGFEGDEWTFHFAGLPN